MASGTTIYVFDIDLNDVDRGVYAALNLRVAQHPSESPAYLITRVLAYCLEYTEGVAFSKGLSEPDEPAIWVRDLTGKLLAWVEVGLPEPERLHRAGKLAPRVAVYAHKDPTQWLGRLAEERIHRADALEVYSLDPNLISELAKQLDRRMSLALTRSDGELYLTLASGSWQTVVRRLEVETS